MHSEAHIRPHYDAERLISTAKRVCAGLVNDSTSRYISQRSITLCGRDICSRPILQPNHTASPSFRMALTYTEVPIHIQGTSLTISTIHNLNSNPPILFLHGFGSSKEDLADLTVNPSLQHHAYIAYDAPGCGQTHNANPSTSTIPFLVETAEAILSHFQIPRFHLIGHSMGGLTALLLASRQPDRVLSFVNIKGNLAPEDCFLSRQIFDFPTEDSEDFLDAFIQRACATKSYGNYLFASTLRSRVRAHAVRPIFESMVRYSDEEDLLGMFLRLPCAKMFMFGVENRRLSYLRRLEREGVMLAEIAESGHFPMYSNPVEMYRRIAGFLEGSRTKVH